MNFLGPYSVQMWENMDQKTPTTDNFCAMDQVVHQIKQNKDGICQQFKLIDNLLKKNFIQNIKGEENNGYISKLFLIVGISCFKWKKTPRNVIYQYLSVTET